MQKYPRRIVDWLSVNATLTSDDSKVNIWAYADSESDLPLLEFVSHPIVVNPDENMKQIAKNNHWPVF